MTAGLRRLRALLLVGALGCAGLPGDGAAPPAVEDREHWLRNDTLHVRMRIPDSPPGRKPVILSPLGDPEALLRRGFVLVEFEIDWERVREALEQGGRPESPAPEEPTGESVGAWLLASPRPGIVGRGYFALIAGNVAIVSDVLDLLESLPEVDPSRIAIAGSSTQGFVALEALAREPRLAAGVVRVACGDYHRFLRSSSLGLKDDPRWLPAGELRLDPDYEAELREREPIRHPERLPPRPLLLVVGSEDRAIPIACARSTAASLRPAYEAAGVPDRFQMIVFDGAGHHLGEVADALTLHWWERWLLPADRIEAGG
jgi:hypothetical protein